MSNTIMKNILLSALLFVLMTSAVSAVALPITVLPSTEIDGQTVVPGSPTRLNIERDQPFEVRVILLATQDLTNVEVQSFISGYEYNDVERVAATTQLFDMAANTTYTKRLTLRLPADATADRYKLRLVIADRNSDPVVQNYDLQLDAPRHLLRVDDVSIFSAGHGNQVVAGDPLLANVRIKNFGQRQENDIKVRVAVSDLGVSATKYIDNIHSDKSEETGNVYLKLPQCATPGVYPISVDVTYDNSNRHVSDKSQSITVVKNPVCDKQDEPRTVVVQVVPQQPQTPPMATAAVTADTTDTSDSSLGKIRSALEIFLVVLFAIFIVIGIIVFFSRLMHDPDDE